MSRESNTAIRKQRSVRPNRIQPLTGLSQRPANVDVLPTIWLYRYIYDNGGRVVGGKARLVILGNRQAYEIDENNYAPVVNLTSLRAALVWAVHNEIEHIDCNTAFLNSEVAGEIYVFQPKGYALSGEEHLV